MPTHHPGTPGTHTRLADAFEGSARRPFSGADAPHESSPGECSSPRLTARERTVLRLLIDGKRNLEISRELAITERTVKFHVRGLFQKLGVSSRTQVVSQALQRGLLVP